MNFKLRCKKNLPIKTIVLWCVIIVGIFSVKPSTKNVYNEGIILISETLNVPYKKIFLVSGISKNIMLFKFLELELRVAGKKTQIVKVKLIKSPFEAKYRIKEYLVKSH